MPIATMESVRIANVEKNLFKGQLGPIGASYQKCSLIKRSLVFSISKFAARKSAPTAILSDTG